MGDEAILDPVTRERVNRLRKDFDQHEQDQCAEQVRIWNAIDNLKNRLPNWASLIIAVLTGTVGWLVSALT